MKKSKFLTSNFKFKWRGSARGRVLKKAKYYYNFYFQHRFQYCFRFREWKYSNKHLIGENGKSGNTEGKLVATRIAYTKQNVDLYTRIRVKFASNFSAERCSLLLFFEVLATRNMTKKYAHLILILNGVRFHAYDILVRWYTKERILACEKKKFQRNGTPREINARSERGHPKEANFS